MADKSELTMLQEFVDAAPNTQTGALVQWGINRIEELEAKLTSAEALIGAHNRQFYKLRDGLRELAEKWRGIVGDPGTNLVRFDCADEMEALLGKESEDE